MIPPVDNNLDHLDPNFRKKVDLFLAEAKDKGFNIKVYEAKRTQERQQYLYSIGRTIDIGKTPVTWTLYSKHLDGLAVDIVFVVNGAITWQGDYLALRAIARKYEIGDLGAKEYCHFEDNGKPLFPGIEEKPKNTEIPDDFGKILQEFVDKGYQKVFVKEGSDNPITEKRAKQLIEIGFAKKGL